MAIDDGDELEREIDKTDGGADHGGHDDGDRDGDDLPKGASVREHIEKALRDTSAEPAGDDKEDKPRGRDRERDRDRGADGKLASDKDAGKQDPDSKTGDKAGPSTATETTDIAPKTWKKDAQAIWNTIPPRARAEILKREQDGANGVAHLKQQIAQTDQHVSRLDPVFQKMGLDRSTGLQRAVEWMLAVDGNPARVIPELARSYGLNLQALGGQQPQGGQGQNPALQQYLQQHLGPITREINNLKQVRAQESQAASDAHVNAWAKDKPHYAAVRQAMGDLVDMATRKAHGGDTRMLQSFQAANGSIDLDKLYDHAVWSNPETRELAKAAEARARRDERQAAADKARRAGSSVRPGAPGSAGPVNSGKQPKKGMSVRETIYDAIEQQRS